METIKNYLDNMFASLPKTDKIYNLKNDILSNMEEKYNELKGQGKSENEAIGIVISEFGNIDELVNELGIQQEDTVSKEPFVTSEEAEAYLKTKKTTGFQIGIGVILCILSPSILILISILSEARMCINDSNTNAAEIFGVIILLIFIAVAVGIFIFTGMQFERFKYIEDGVQLPASLAADLKVRYDRYTPTFYLNIILGVCILILSPVAIFITYLLNNVPDELGVIFLLIMVAIAVFLFILSGTIREGYEHLLQIGDYDRQKKKENKVIGAVSAIVWPIAVVIFLVSGFVYDKWDICWIVFPITGILFGMFSAAYSIITNKQE